MSEIKQVKVDNWGIYFLQRLKHFFNRTDYCDLTLQFQDNAQLKVHRLVLNACTEYFELLERTCEMYEDCLVMPDDLQADVVVPIVNFMYTGQLGFKPELLERLYQTAQVMNMPVLTKLLDAHRNQMHRTTQEHQNIRSYSKSFDSLKSSKPTAVASTSYMSTKRSYSKAFENNTFTPKYKKPVVEKVFKPDLNVSNNDVQPYTYSQKESTEYPIKKKPSNVDPRPTRYELPEELDCENVFDNSFTSISYGSTPLMVHPETVKRYSSKKCHLFDDASNTKRFIHGTSTVDIVECKKISTNDNIFDDVSDNIQDDIFSSNSSKRGQRDTNQLFDLILDNDVPKATIEIKDSESTKKPKIDHAKIISDVLKKYPHLVKGNKNIKLRVLDTPIKSKKQKVSTSIYHEEKDMKKNELECSFDLDVLESKDAAKLIAMGVENIKGPWICLICGTPGRAITFTTYYKFRRHLVEVHNEKPIVNMCEYCGLKSLKRNYLLHHLYTKHGVPPPPPYHFPKCNHCNYIALTEALLIKHKSTHVENRNFGCNVCAATFSTSSQLLTHIQKTGHKYSAERKTILHCVYCLKTFSRETNLYTHLKLNHKQSAQSDKIIDESDDERDDKRSSSSGKSDMTKNVSLTYANEYENVDVKYQIQQKADGNIQVLSKSSPQTSALVKHKILNPSFNLPTKSARNTKISLNNKNKQETCELKLPSKVINKESDEIVMINGNEYIIKDNQLIPRTQNTSENEEYLLSNVITEQSDDNSVPTTSIEIPIIHHPDAEDSKMIIKKPIHMNEPIEIVVSSEEQYKALMSSTHSIIFEEPNKALTVLTAPQTSTLESSTIDLDNTQSNDMMIIQENFPLNVSDTVSADNNNIVVVYSHPVDDASKQFQYIQPQGIEAQFIQSSPMGTHNYDTVTATTPVMSAHILDTNVNESWQNNIKENIESVPIELQLQHPVEIKNTKQSIENPQSSSDNIQTIEDTSSSVEDSTIPANVNDIKDTTTEKCLENTNNTIAVSMAQVLINEVTNMPTINLSITEPSEQLVHKEIQTESLDTVCSNESDISDNNIKNKDIEQLNVIDEKNHENIIVLQQKVEEIDINRDVQNSVAQDASVLHQTFITEEAVVTSGSHIVEVPTTSIEVTVTKAGKEQLPDLTAEWTEVDDGKLVADKVEKQVTEGAAYVEESIENIQHEMAKQLQAITTINNSVQYTEPLNTLSTIQSEPESESATKELDTGNNTSPLVEHDSELATGETAVKVFILNNDKGTNISLLSSDTVESESIEIKNESSNDITKNQEIASEEHQQDIVVTDTEHIVIHSENVSDPVNLSEASSESKEMLNNESEVKTEEDTNSLQESNPTPPQQPVISLNKQAREKINIILNDWDDNDSQDDSKSESDVGVAKENDETGQEVEIVQEVEIPQAKVPDKGTEISNDKIKSIVSDWDDDDEDESK